MTFAELWRELEPLGRDGQTGGYRRYSWTAANFDPERSWLSPSSPRKKALGFACPAWGAA
jgi:N-carbamoyl-L-amino-acid hydrolase